MHGSSKLLLFLAASTLLSWCCGLEMSLNAEGCNNNLERVITRLEKAVTLRFERAAETSEDAYTNQTSLRSKICEMKDEATRAENALNEELAYAMRYNLNTASQELRGLLDKSSKWRSATDRVDTDVGGDDSTAAALEGIVNRAETIQSTLQTTLRTLRRKQDSCEVVTGTSYCEARQRLATAAKRCFHLCRQHLERSAFVRTYRMYPRQLDELEDHLDNQIREFRVMKNFVRLHQHTQIGIKLNRAKNQLKIMRRRWRFNRNELNLIKEQCFNARADVIQLEPVKARCRDYPAIPISMYFVNVLGRLTRYNKK